MSDELQFVVRSNNEPWWSEVSRAGLRHRSHNSISTTNKSSSDISVLKCGELIVAVGAFDQGLTLRVVARGGYCFESSFVNRLAAAHTNTVIAFLHSQ